MTFDKNLLTLTKYLLLEECDPPWKANLGYKVLIVYHFNQSPTVYLSRCRFLGAGKQKIPRHVSPFWAGWVPISPFQSGAWMLLPGKWQWRSSKASSSLKATHPWSPATLLKKKTPLRGWDSWSERNPSLRTATLLPRRQTSSKAPCRVSVSQSIWGHLKITLTWNTALLGSLLERFKEFWKSQQDFFFFFPLE